MTEFMEGDEFVSGGTCNEGRQVNKKIVNIKYW